LVCWYDNRDASDAVYGQVFNPARVAVGANFRIGDSDETQAQKFPAAAGLAGGGFVVAWIDYRNGPYPDDPDIYAQFVTADGLLEGENFRVHNAGQDSPQTEPQVGSAPTGGFVICWRDERNGDGDIYARRYLPNKSATAVEFMVNDEDIDVQQSTPAVEFSDAKMYFAWTDNRNAGLFDILGRIVTYDDPTISIVPSFVLFSGTDGQTNPAPRDIIVTNAGAGVLEWAANAADDWLTINPIFGTAPTTVSISADMTGLGYGLHETMITFKDQNDPQISSTVLVRLSIDYGKPLISGTPTTLEFTSGTVGPEPSPQLIAIDNLGAGSLYWQAETNESWLFLTPTGGVAPSTLSVSIDRGTMLVGVNSGTISIIDPTAYNSPFEIAVEATLSQNAPVVEVSDSLIEFQAFELQGIPAPQEILLTNGGGSALTFTLGEIEADWLIITPQSGLAPEFLQFSVATDTLPAGDYLDTLWIMNDDALNSPFPVAVNLHIEAVAPVVSLETESLEFNGTRVFDPPDPIEFTIDNLGGGELNWDISTIGSWLICDPTAGTGQSTISCHVETDGLSSATLSPLRPQGRQIRH